MEHLTNLTHFINSYSKKKLTTIIVLFIFFLQTGCQKMDTTQKAIDDAIIKDYLKKNKTNATKTESGLYYHIIPQDNLPKGKQVSPNSSLIISYKGLLSNDSLFEQNLFGTGFNLTKTIKGWSEGLTKFKVGDTGCLYIPSHLGYGSNTIDKSPTNSVLNKIPANSVLIYGIKVIEN